MRAHKVSILEMPPRRFRFAASHKEASEQRRSWMAEHQLRLKAIVIEPVEIPTSKADLIEFLNKLVGDA